MLPHCIIEHSWIYENIKVVSGNKVNAIIFYVFEEGEDYTICAMFIMY